MISYYYYFILPIKPEAHERFSLLYLDRSGSLQYFDKKAEVWRNTVTSLMQILLN
jgi:hypothetical protein